MKPVKPLGRKAYGSIPHLPGRRMGPADHHCHVGQEAICTIKKRDKHDTIIVTEKLDGGNVAIAKINDKIYALGRAGYPASTSPFEQFIKFDEWVNKQVSRWDELLSEGEAIHAEWLLQAHGTVYNLPHEPFVVFDLTRNGKRVSYNEMVQRCDKFDIINPHCVSIGDPISVDDALSNLGQLGKHGSTETVEGVVYRVERKGEFDFMTKYVHPDKVDGKYLPEISGNETIWNYQL